MDNSAKAYKEIIIYNNLFGNLILNREDNQISKVFFFKKPPLLNNIYLAEVSSYHKGLNVFFVKLSNNSNGWYALLKKTKTLNLAVGQKIIVQITKEGTLDKYPVVSTNITLTGFYSVYCPLNPTLTASNISSSSALELKFSHTIEPSLKELFLPALTTHLRNYNGEVIIRSAAHLSKLKDILNELDVLKKLWDKISKGDTIGLLYAPSIWLSNIYQNQIQEAVISSNNHNILLAIKQELAEHVPFLHFSLTSTLSTDHYQQIINVVNDLATNVIEVNSEINLVINNTEAFTMIDVNFSGNSRIENNKEEALYQANLAIIAKLKEIIKLKDLSGAILIDTLKLKSKSKATLLLEHFKRELSEIKGLTVLGFTRLGILELVRHKNYAGTADKIFNPCPTCNSNYQSLSLDYLKFKALLLINSLHNKNPLAVITVKSNPSYLSEFKSEVNTFLKGGYNFNYISDSGVKNDIIVY